MMQTLCTLAELRSIKEPIHLALGTFDGFHIGHQTVIKAAVKLAHKKGEKAAVFTFSNHPLSLFHPENAPTTLLNSHFLRNKILTELGVSYLIFLPFDHTIADLTAEDFLHLLSQSLNLQSITVGTDWQFGKGKTGNFKKLQQQALQLGFQAQGIPMVTDRQGIRISSSHIRKNIQQGDFKSAQRDLNRPYTITGKVIQGRQLARQLGFPTANIELHHETLPPAGVYTSKITLPSGLVYKGIANIGFRPTVDPERKQQFLEVHLFDFTQNIYGEFIQLEFIDFLRSEQQFSSIEVLRNQILQDIDKAKKHLFST